MVRKIPTLGIEAGRRFTRKGSLDVLSMNLYIWPDIRVIKGRRKEIYVLLASAQGMIAFQNALSVWSARKAS